MAVILMELRSQRSNGRFGLLGTVIKRADGHEASNGRNRNERFMDASPIGRQDMEWFAMATE
jgi:hypothetical protein